MMDEQNNLFQPRIVPAKEGSGKLFEEEMLPNSGPVTCLGMTFDNDEERQKYFIEKLRGKLQDPEFRKIEGFPIGSDEDILTLSDPPYYTACPNPWIADFIAEWEAQKPQPEGDQYHREPFVANVIEGKNDPIYKAHSYHTKVPHKAIMRYILHYTEPGDIVFDGFCGTGMTGVAAQMCGERDVVMSLGYQVKHDGTIFQEGANETGKKTWVPFSKLGIRRTVLNDLSPAATFIAYNYNTPVDVVAFEKEAKRILNEVEEECGWMYETLHTDGKTNGKITYTVWSDVFICPECAEDVIFWEAAVGEESLGVKDDFPCPYCNTLLNKRNMERAWTTKYDSAIEETVRQAKQIPVLINYKAGGKRFEKTPDENDLNLLDKIEKSKIPYWVPVKKIERGDVTPGTLRIGLTHQNHLYQTRNLWILSSIRSKTNHKQIRLVFQSIVSTLCSKLVRYNFKKRGNGILSGTIYVPSLNAEANVFNAFLGKLRDFVKAVSMLSHNLVSTSSSGFVSFPSNSIDYIFIDPPFGANIPYSEVNLFWEGWLNIFTNNTEEAIESKTQRKGANEYRLLMAQCFKEIHRVLKPGRWMTVEFSNTKASVWNSIQTALTEAGFIVANVSALDKKQGSFHAVTNTTSVKQDLVISAYKPNGGFEERFQKEAQTEEGVWDFIRTHLKYLPVTKRHGVLLQFVPERDSRILFDQMVAYYVRKGYLVPISSQEFQIGLSQRFIERDSMYFLPDQIAEYDRKKMAAGGLNETIEMFVKDEESMIHWLRQLLKQKPQTFADINPKFMQQLDGWSKNEAQLDLRELLNQNFLSYDGNETVPEQIHAYLSSNWKAMRNLSKEDPALVAKAQDRWYVPDPNKAGDLEKLREKALLKEFDVYKQEKKKLKVFRLEAVRTGFKKAWQEHDYATIVAVADNIPNNVLEEDPKLLMWYDQAVTRMGGE